MTEGQLRAWLGAYGDAYRRQDPDAGAEVALTAGGLCSSLREWWNSREEEITLND